MQGLRNASQLARASIAVSRQGLLRQSVQLAGTRIAFDPLVEPRAIEFVKPSAEFRQLTGGEIFNGFFDVFDIAHAEKLAFFR